MKILLVEDDKALADGLMYALQRENYQLDWTTSGEEAVALVRNNGYSLIILDVRLPGMDGFSVCRQIRSFSHIPLLILSAKDEEVDKVTGLSLGADDYVTKPFSLPELLSRIKALTRRSYEYSQPSNSLLQVGDMEIDKERRRITVRGKEVRLTPTEFGILQKLAESPGVVFSREAILEWLWGIEGEYLTEQNVSVHIHRIREKIEVDASKPRYIVTIRGFGYKLEEYAQGHSTARK
jgi:DNA-binding response OmpR family regulator